MPHLILQYSSNIREKREFDTLFIQLHQTLVDLASADLKTCQSRTVEYKVFRVGNGEEANGFVHLEVRLLEGRSSSALQETGERMLEILQRFYSRSIQELRLQVAVEIKEMPRSFYFKTSSA